MARTLKVDFDVFNQSINSYEEAINLFEENLSELNKSIDDLRTSGWVSAASQAFFESFDNKWKTNMELHIKVLRHFKECLELAQNDYRELDELAKGLTNVLDL
ncbi:WXG100 family type VII secretion target [Intestinibacter sp.]|uniref:WXG100 family type VII secretion target n=1 Tax=Intestinibacter sp. TaxID=1965304 RepID=UPI002A74AEB7|nr:WXG100 family type VII secretion target [Intestinibacter sp.]MDY2735225.1 WXG100 family type VII secretion target [Intestinibacter sp.]